MSFKSGLHQDLNQEVAIGNDKFYLIMITSLKKIHFPHNWPFVRELHRSPVNSPYKGQLRAALMSSLICIGIDSWVNNRKAGDSRRHRAHYDATVMYSRSARLTYVYPLGNRRLLQADASSVTIKWYVTGDHKQGLSIKCSTTTWITLRQQSHKLSQSQYEHFIGMIIAEIQIMLQKDAVSMKHWRCCEVHFSS